VKLTYMSFLMKATVDALKAVPSSTRHRRRQHRLQEGHQPRDCRRPRLGADRAVIKHAERRTARPEPRHPGLAARAVEAAQAGRGAGRHVHDHEPGVFGAQFGMPIISQPQVAILGVARSRSAWQSSRTMPSASGRRLSLDRLRPRLIDGAVADEFMSHSRRPSRISTRMPSDRS